MLVVGDQTTIELRALQFTKRLPPREIQTESGGKPAAEYLRSKRPSAAFQTANLGDRASNEGPNGFGRVFSGWRCGGQKAKCNFQWPMVEKGPVGEPTTASCATQK